MESLCLIVMNTSISFIVYLIVWLWIQSSIFSLNQRFLPCPPISLNFTWQTLMRMGRANITEKQVGREFWFHAIHVAAQMTNQVPGRLGRKLTTPFELVHGIKPDASTWFELFSVGFFPHDSDEGATKSKLQAQTLAGIVLGCDTQSNTILFYNPINKQYYRPPIYKLD